MHKSGLSNNEIVRVRKGSTRALFATILLDLGLLCFIAFSPLRESDFANNQLPYLLLSTLFLTPSLTHLYYGFTVIPDWKPYNVISVMIDGLTSEVVSDKVVVSKGVIPTLASLATMGGAILLCIYALSR